MPMPEIRTKAQIRVARNVAMQLYVAANQVELVGEESDAPMVARLRDLADELHARVIEAERI